MEGSRVSHLLILNLCYVCGFKCSTCVLSTFSCGKSWGEWVGPRVVLDVSDRHVSFPVSKAMKIPSDLVPDRHGETNGPFFSSLCLQRATVYVCLAVMFPLQNLITWPTPCSRILVEGNSSSASQEIPRILWNVKIHHRIHNSSPHLSILNQTNPDHVPLTFISDPF